MTNLVDNESTHAERESVVTSNVWEVLGFSAAQTTALEVKAELLSAILDHVREEGYTQRQLAEMLDEHQPSVSNLMRGRIGQVSIEKLLRYADRLGLKAHVTVFPAIPQNSPKRKLTASTAQRAPRRTAAAV